MKIGVFDLEMTGLNADSAIILCIAHMPYEGKKKDVKLIRADQFPSWKTNKSNNKDMVVAAMAALEKYDILIAHNGSRFDRPFLNALCLKYGLKPALRWVKFVDPCSLSWRHLRLHRNSLGALQAFLGIPVSKTPVAFDHWLKASLDGNKKSMDYICEHCVIDVVVLEAVYDRVRSLIDKVDKGASAY
jgi:uncharacterized protein YprB with RNaseH-like and TPR domain